MDISLMTVQKTPIWHPDSFLRKKPLLEKRLFIIKTIRSFFDDKGFWEVETPALQISPGMEPHIMAFQTAYEPNHIDDPKVNYYLHTSPEFAMKKLLVSGMEKIYQLAHTYRNGERSSKHHPEFTMLEWYRTGADYHALMEDCHQLILKIAQGLSIHSVHYDGQSCALDQGIEILSVSEAFLHYADIDLTLSLGDGMTVQRDILAAQALEKGMRVSAEHSWEDIFFMILLEKIEPRLGCERPTILSDYPASMAALSRRKSTDPRYAERFELYICGLELANAFSELTDPVEQEARFKADMDLKEKLYGVRYPIDPEFLDALKQGMPESAGIAMGVDRLVMLFAETTEIEDVLYVPLASHS